MHSDLTIVIPAYNCQEYIRAALQSALMCQGAPVLVSDDCSQDGTLDIIRSVACQTDGRITLVNPTSNLGMTHNWQHLMERVATPFCLKLDGDDIICPHYVTAAMERLRKEPEVAACGGAGQVIDQHTYTNSQPLDASFARQDFHGSFQRLAGVDAFEFLLRWAPYPASSATIYRMSAWRAAGGFDASFGWCPDREIWFRLIRIGAVLWTSSPSALRRVHDANITVHYLESGRSLDEQRRLLAKLDRTFQGHREQRLLGRQMLSLAIRHVRRCFFRRRNQQGSASQLLTQSALLAAKGTWRQLPFQRRTTMTPSEPHFEATPESGVLPPPRDDVAQRRPEPNRRHVAGPGNAATRHRAPAGPLRLLLIGPLPAEGQTIGGAKVIAKEACQLLSSFSDVSLRVVDTATDQQGGGLRGVVAWTARALAVLLHALVRGGASQVWLLHVNSRAAFTLAPALWIISRLRRRPLIVRFIGGRFARVLQERHALIRILFWQTVMRSELVLFETKEIAAVFATCPNSRWFPNTRGIHCSDPRREVCRRFLFASQIRPEKGVTAALLATRELPLDCSLDFFGSVMDPRLLDDIRRTPRAHYGGELSHDDLLRVLPEYDCLLLPTYWPGEGLPGVILEAFQCGLPVIATHWMNLSELVISEKNGLLIPPQDTEALVAAMQRLHGCPELFAQLCAGARQTGREYDSEVWYRQLVDWARQLCHA